MTASNLSPPIDWSPVTNPIQSTGMIFSATLPATNSQSRFYQLQSNEPVR